jgi:peptidoglycan/xylan/chitin deacetylase (PgdA/CDA1 family)
MLPQVRIRDVLFSQIPLLTLTLFLVAVWVFSSAMFWKRANTHPPAGPQAGEEVMSRVTTYPSRVLRALKLQGSGDEMVVRAQREIAFMPTAPEVINSGNHSRREVAITLDDGYNIDTRILGLLETHGVKCTVFLVGNWARSHPDLVRRMEEDGFEICNHTLHHLWLTKLPDDQIRYEVIEGERAIFNITGKQLCYFRPPGGFLDARVTRVVSSLGYRIVMWSLDSADTRYPSVPASVRAANILNRVKPGYILLFHFGGYSTFDTLSIVLSTLKARGYHFVTLTELLRSGRRPHPCWERARD